MVNNINTLTQRNVLDVNKKYFASTLPCKPIKCENTMLTKNQKLGIRFCTAASVCASLALLAKTSKTPYSLNIKKMFATPIKDTFLSRVDYGAANVAFIGAASCLGGYIGGLIFDKDKRNIQAKKREMLIQYTNITLPIATVVLSKKVGEFISNKSLARLSNNASKLSKLVCKLPAILMPIMGLGVGMYVGNKAANKLNKKIFGNKDERPIEIKDFSAHLDDICITSKFVVENNIVTKAASRFIPVALMVAGSEIGTCREKQ